MTNEEAIKFLSQIKDALLANNSWLPSTDDPIKESFGMAINALTAQPEKRTEERTETHACDLISRQWLMECVNEGWIKFDTKKDENRFIHLVRDIAPSAQQDIEEDEDIPMEYFENGGI